ncbi:hypothetical protein JIN85_12740 [Luteolibacter pohnpeiensis]|uniref:Acyl-CoA reductase n=1 Tax=Luteolibacter pohnpeiensis TaxID=454153 RepID=A0A934S632_9BACT|nr:acyl-CoA reductase [Luteolibacter pohnpeiensis]MBK1883286.1 hypothetical protein [Luteolibacter pohnpeiensis]
MSSVFERIDLLVEQASALEPWTGSFDKQTLLKLLEEELGDPMALDQWVNKGPIQTRAIALSPVLHVVSGNTPHAAFQTVFRGLLLGCENWVKIPSAGLPEFEEWVAGLPPELAQWIELRRDLPSAWLNPAAAVIYGGADTIETFRNLLPAATRRIEHGPKLSIGVVFEPNQEAAGKIATDILRHDQRGCLSVQAIFVDGSEHELMQFGDWLADELAAYRRREARPFPSLSDSGAVSNTREIARFRQANGDEVRLWESHGSTDWTVLYEREPELAPGPLNGFVKLHPFPKSGQKAALGQEVEHVSTVVIHPFSVKSVDSLGDLQPPRICAAGMAQEPTIFWNADGEKPLASLVRWRDLG